MATFKFKVELSAPFTQEVTAADLAEALREYYCLNGPEAKVEAI